MKFTAFEPIATTARVRWSGEKPKAVHQQLAAIERAETRRQWIAESDHAEQLVVDGIGDRDGVGELLGGVDAIATADRNVGIGGSAWDLSGRGILRANENRRNQEDCQIRDALHVTAPWLDWWADSISVRSVALTAPPAAKVWTAAAVDRRRGASRQFLAAGSR